MRTVVESACEQEAENKNGSRDLPKFGNPGGFRLPEFLRRLSITSFIIVEVNERYFVTVFYFAFAEFVQIGLPTRIMFEIAGNTLGEKNVTGISAIHHAL